MADPSSNNHSEDFLHTCGMLADDVAGIVTRAGAHGNVLIARTRHGLARFAGSRIHQHVGDDTTTVSLSIAVDGRSATATTTDCSKDAVTALVERTIGAARQQPVDEGWPGPTPAGTPQPQGLAAFDEATADASPAQRTDMVGRFITATGAVADDHAAAMMPGSASDTSEQADVAGFVDTEATWAAFASTDGHRVTGASTRATVDGIHRMSQAAGAGHATAASLSALDAGLAGAQARTTALASHNPVDVDPGTWPVVLGPEAVGTMVIFLGAYGFNAKAYLDGSSFATLGAQTFDPTIDLWEDPFDARATGLRFDAQGVARQRFPLIEGGKIAGLAHDRRTALRAGSAASTGNALVGAESWGAIPLTPVLGEGTSTPRSLISNVEHGVYVSRFHYCRVLDPKTMVVTGLTRNGTFLIEDGQITRPVTDLRFTQSFVDALTAGSVSGIGNDARYADSELGAGLAIVPSLSLANWQFTGGARG